MATLMAVHAHPDDEVISTGGILLRAAAEGHATVLVTCTNGDQGDGPGGVKPGELGHDDAAVAAVRAAELAASARLLQIRHVESLGYPDSGIDGWARHAEPSAFANLPVDGPAEALAALIDRYAPDVVVTYDETGGSRHPDHVRTHEVTVAAVARAAHRPALWFATIPRSRMDAIRERFRQTGEGWDAPAGVGVPDEEIAAVVDVRPYAATKQEALRAHASQSDAAFLKELSGAELEGLLGWEAFVRADGGLEPRVEILV